MQITVHGIALVLGLEPQNLNWNLFPPHRWSSSGFNILKEHKYNKSAKGAGVYLTLAEVTG